MGERRLLEHNRVVDHLGATMHVDAGPGDGRGRFTALHLPAGDATRGLVVCPPLHIEATRTYRREHLLGWELARRGIAVQRFHYRGTGHSTGDLAEVDLDGLVEDALWAAERLRARADVHQVSVLGTRLGALVAARAAASLPGAGLVMWEPAIDIDRHLQEVFRARLLSDMRHGAVTGRTGAQLIAELEQASSLDVLGYPITARLRRSFLGVTLDAVVPTDPRSILVVQLGRKPALRAELSAVVDGWRARGHEVATRAIVDPTGWWFGNSDRGQTIDVRVSGIEAVSATVEHLCPGPAVSRGDEP
jgi:hypothetical protein